MSRSGRDFWITVQPISKMNRLEKTTQLRFVSHYTFLILGAENGAQVDLPSSAHYTDGYFRITVVQPVHIRVDAWTCINVLGTSDSNYA